MVRALSDTRFVAQRERHINTHDPVMNVRVPSDFLPEATSTSRNFPLQTCHYQALRGKLL